MKYQKSQMFVVLVALAVASACSSPVTPAGSVSVSVATPLAPANGAQIPNAAQPVTLAIGNATVTNSGAAVIYAVEVATDAGFANKVFAKDVPQVTPQTTVALDVLTAGRDYYWHVRTSTADTVGTFTSPVKFTIGPAITIGAPAPVSPTAGFSAISWPTFIVTNAPKTGPVGTVTYTFEISANSAFSPVVVSATVNEGPSNQTSFKPDASLPTPQQVTQYFWRVTARDQGSAIAGAPMSVQQFTFNPPTSQAAKLAAQEGVQLWPGQQPTGSTGHAKLGDSWEVQTVISHGGARFLSPLIECLQVFDLLDRGFDPQGAIDWMHAHGYPIAGAYFPVASGVIGFDFVYIAFNPTTGAWDMILRSEGGL